MLESHSHFLKAQRRKRSFEPKLQPLFFLRFRRNSCFQAEGFSSFFDAGCIRLTFRTFFHPRRMMKAEPSCRLFGAAIFHLEGCVSDDFIPPVRRYSRDAAYVSADGAGCGARIPAPAISPKRDEPADGARCGHHARRVVLFAPCARADVRAVPPAKPAPDVQRRISARRAARAVGGRAAFTPDAPNATVRRAPQNRSADWQHHPAQHSRRLGGRLRVRCFGDPRRSGVAQRVDACHRHCAAELP